jgi:hypothetical protein
MLVFAVAAVVTIGCNGIRMRSPRDPVPGQTGTPYPQRGANSGIVKRGGAAAMKTERFCRASMPGGWIAVDYVADSGCAATSRAIDVHPVALAVQYSDLPTGYELEVCSQERTPTTWYDVGWVDQDGRCPVDGQNLDPNRRTVKRIRKH